MELRPFELDETLVKPTELSFETCVDIGLTPLTMSFGTFSAEVSHNG